MNANWVPPIGAGKGQQRGSDARVESVTQHSPPAAKIALFRSLFRGRDDVYPRRFESRKTGRAGYQPACANEWVRGVCEKPRVKCAECPHRQFLPLTDAVVRWHLSGRDDQDRDFVMGIYPLLQDETCYFLAVDFDRDSWQEDARAYLETCRRLELPAVLERSRSGQGGHVWLFFEEAIPARLARNLGAYVLTETMERRPDIGFGSYDRFFPNQDTLPQGGFGNLIALPLQKRTRAADNSVFIDDQFQPYPDQWEFLSAIRKLTRAEVEAVVREAEGRGRILGVRMVLASEDEELPWMAPPSRGRREPPIVGALPAELELVIGDQIYVPKANLPPGLCNRLVRLAAFQNPEFYRAQAMRLSTCPGLLAREVRGRKQNRPCCEVKKRNGEHPDAVLGSTVCSSGGPNPYRLLEAIHRGGGFATARFSGAPKGFRYVRSSASRLGGSKLR